MAWRGVVWRGGAGRAAERHGATRHDTTRCDSVCTYTQTGMSEYVCHKIQHYPYCTHSVAYCPVELRLDLESSLQTSQSPTVLGWRSSRGERGAVSKRAGRPFQALERNFRPLLEGASQDRPGPRQGCYYAEDRGMTCRMDRLKERRKMSDACISRNCRRHHDACRLPNAFDRKSSRTTSASVTQYTPRDAWCSACATPDRSRRRTCGSSARSSCAWPSRSRSK